MKSGVDRWSAHFTNNSGGIESGPADLFLSSLSNLFLINDIDSSMEEMLPSNELEKAPTARD